MGETCFARLACGHARICLAGLTREKSSKIHYCIGSLNVGVAQRVQHLVLFIIIIINTDLQHMHVYMLVSIGVCDIKMYCDVLRV